MAQTSALIPGVRAATVPAAPTTLAAQAAQTARATRAAPAFARPLAAARAPAVAAFAVAAAAGRSGGFAAPATRSAPAVVAIAHGPRRRGARVTIAAAVPRAARQRPRPMLVPRIVLAPALRPAPFTSPAAVAAASGAVVAAGAAASAAASPATVAGTTAAAIGKRGAPARPGNRAQPSHPFSASSSISPSSSSFSSPSFSSSPSSSFSSSSSLPNGAEPQANSETDTEKEYGAVDANDSSDTSAGRNGTSDAHQPVVALKNASSGGNDVDRSGSTMTASDTHEHVADDEPPARDRNTNPFAEMDVGMVFAGVFVACVLLLVAIGWFSGGISADSFIALAEWFEGLGPIAIVAYAVLYFLLELIAVVPATPLTLGAGYLFGVLNGAIAVSIASTLAAATGFLIARYGLRDYVAKVATKYPKFRALDRAIGREGFKFVLLLRLSPLLPFAISNYLYGLTSVRLRDYVVASWLGMLPGTIAYVSAGAAVSAIADLSLHKGSVSPVLVGLGVTATILALGTIGKLASSAIAEAELEEDTV